MAEGAGHERICWNTYPWLIPNDNSGDGRDEHGDDQKPIDDEKLIGLDITGEQTEVGLVSRVASDEVVAAHGGGIKNVGGVVEKTIQEGNDSEGEGDDEKGKADHQTRNHEIRVSMERERRKKMINTFGDLRALLPQLSPKAHKTTIVEEAISSIKSLQQTLENLQKHKLERLHGISTNTGIASLMPCQNIATNNKESFLANKDSSKSNLGTIFGPSSTSLSLPQSFPTIFQTWTSSNVTLNVCGMDAHINVCSSKNPGLFTTICFVLEKHKLEVVSALLSSDDARSMYMIHVRANVPHEFAEGFPYVLMSSQKAAAEILHWVTPKTQESKNEGVLQGDLQQKS